MDALNQKSHLSESSDDDESDEDTSSDDDAEETDDVSLKVEEGPDDARSSFFKRLMREVDDESLSCNLIISKVCDNLNYLQLNHQDNQALARTLSRRSLRIMMRIILFCQHQIPVTSQFYIWLTRILFSISSRTSTRLPGTELINVIIL